MRHLELAEKRAAAAAVAAHLIDAKRERKHRRGKFNPREERGARMDVSLTCERTTI